MKRYATLLTGVLIMALATVSCGQRVEQHPSTTKYPEISADDFDAGSFAHSESIDNTWFPLTPGRRYVYEGATSEGTRRPRHQVVFTVTDLTKVVGGVRSVVTWDRDYSSGQLVETEIALFAQDDDGNVWHLGQYPEEYEDGKLDKAPAWFHGINGAKAGIAMKAHPRLGAPDYAQGYAPPPINWIDRARTYRMGARTCVPAGCYDDVLVTEEFEVTKPDAFQLKYYAPGVGNVRVGWRGSKEEDKEVLVLVERTRLGPREVAEVRDAVLRLEARAYRLSEDVYGQTEPARPRS